MKKYIELDESPINHKYLLKINFDLIPIKNINKGSAAVLFARLMGLSWPDFLRMCRDIFGAEISGKGTLYPVPYFKKDKLSHELEILLNKRVEYALSVRENPNLEKMIDELKNKNEENSN